MDPRRSGDGGIGVAKPARIVLDASVAIKWFVREEDRDRALVIRRHHVEGSILLSAPDLLTYEVCNALRYSPEFEEEDVETAAEALLDFKMELVQPSRSLMRKAVRDSYRYDIILYDGVYVTLAEVLGKQLITADERLYRKTEASGRTVLLSSKRCESLFNNGSQAHL